jgi:carboxyl-terminal processing protease
MKPQVNSIAFCSKKLISLFVVLILCVSLTSSGAQAAAEKLSSAEEYDINRFINTVAVIQKDYAQPVDEKKLLENAIRGMVNNLDPHSEYLDEDAYKALLVTTAGEFGGLGIEVTTEFGVLKVITPIDNTPAFKAGIKPGDYIVALNGNLVHQMSLNQAIDQMRGKKGSTIFLTIIRKGEKDPLKFSLVRDIIHVDSIKSKMLDNNFGYVRVSQFQQPTAGLLSKAISDLKTQAKGNLKGLILDLRNNPGGLLETAVQVVNMFLDSAKLDKFNKVIVYTEGRVPEAQYKATASGQDILNGAPLIILVNEGSASASEIVAGALQDYHRAIITGTTSFGKGSVQMVLPLDATHAVKLTTALYLTPAGRVIQNQGIIPDVAIADYKLAENKDVATLEPLHELELKGHLANTSSAVPASIANIVSSLAQDDFQLYESLNILKTLSLQAHLQPLASSPQTHLATIP